MDLSLQTQIETYLSHLDGLMRRGRQLRDALAADRSNPSCSNPARSNSESIAATRAWQEDCGVTINQLSGGSKAHWLARSFSAAFLIRSASGHAVEGAEPTEIVTRLLDVLEQAVATLSGMDSGIGPSVSGYSPAPAEAPPPHRFDFVHNPELRPVVEQAYIDSRRALEQEDYDRALRTSCGILEAIVTDALEHARLAARAVSGAPPELPEGKIEEGKTEAVKTEAGKIAEAKIADWSFETRLAVAEKAGLIRSGCARLPAAARTYRDHTDAGGAKTMVSERDARVAGQVLHVVMRDLDPGR
jgi:hypothetical protein